MHARVFGFAMAGLLAACGQDATGPTDGLSGTRGDLDSGGDVLPDTAFAGSALEAYWAFERAADASRPSTGAGAMLPDGTCATSGWIPDTDAGTCVLACGSLTLPIDAATDAATGATIDATHEAATEATVDETHDATADGARDAAVDTAPDASKDAPDDGATVETGPGAPSSTPEFTIFDTQLCVAEPCKPPFAFQQEFVAIFDIPFHCAGSTPSCDCLPPNICGVNGKCDSVDGNVVACVCQPDP